MRFAEGCRGEVDDQKGDERILQAEEKVFPIGREGEVVPVGVRCCDGVRERLEDVCGQGESAGRLRGEDLEE